MRRLPCSISARTYTFVPLWIADIEKMQAESVAAYVAAIEEVGDAHPVAAETARHRQI